MANDVVASAIEHGILGQSELITSFSFAIIAGVLALFTQVYVINSPSTNRRKPTRCHWFAFYISLLLAGLSIFSGYCVSGVFVEMAPQIFSHAFDPQLKFSDQNLPDAPILLLRWLSILQLLLFFLSIPFAVFFAVKNSG